MDLLGKLVLFCYFGAAAYASPCVVGRHEAPDHKYPYLVSLRDNEHICAGSILNKHWILTAASCIAHRDADTYSISAGTNNLDEDGDIYLAEFHIIHENYSGSYLNDIALIRVRGEIFFHDHVKSTGVLASGIGIADHGVMLAGWGSTSVEGPLSNRLQEVKLTEMSFRKCKKRLPGITKKQICTYSTAFKYACRGDSGGPLTNIPTGRPLGIATHRISCGAGIPNIYTRISAYVNWFATILELHAKE